MIIARGGWALAALLAATCAHAENDLQATFDQARPAIVKIRTVDTGHAASGFVWRSADRVVTSLHVVDGSRQINIDYSQPSVTRAAHVDRVLRDADLVLLRVDDPPSVRPLRENARLPGLDQPMHALGYPLNVREISSFSFSSRYGGRKLMDNVPAKVLSKLRQNGYPSPQMEIVKLGTESLLPGLSGAPIIDNEGAVVAIGNGGLEEGALNISWGIPSAQLLALASSDERTLPGASGTRDLFAAELDADMGATVSTADARLTKVRTRTLSELIVSADDQLGLSQLATNFMMFNPMQFEYDIYQDARSGATIVVPQGTALAPGNHGPWKVDLPDDDAGGSVSMYLQIAATGSMNEAQQVSVDFERWIAGQYPAFFWQADPQWSYLVPIRRFDGLIVNRRAFAGQAPGGAGKYGFETLAARNLMFVGAAAINEDRSGATNMRRGQCAMAQFQLPDCDTLYDAERAWAQLVIGLQLTGFSR